MMLSIISPVLNEAESLPALYREIVAACEPAGIEFEVLFIDDGSADGSWEVIASLAEDDERVSGIRFRRNFGKAAALTAGMRAARGRLILMMDADLQDDPAEIPRFLDAMTGGLDVVNGWKKRRFDPWHKVWPSRLFNWTVSRLTGLKLHDHNCGFKLFTSEVAAEIRIYGELHRFISVLAHARGFRVGEMPVHHRPRQFGRSKYGVRRFTRGLLDLLTVKFLTGYGQRPQHLLGAIGLCFFALGLLGVGYLSVIWILTNVFGMGYGPIGDRPLLAYSIASMLLGAQALSLGLLAELIVAYAGRDRDSYSIAQRTRPKSPERERVSGEW
ncbi:MAG: glycosyltransferase family 2 protein [Planctomycetaceae bacterium]